MWGFAQVRTETGSSIVLHFVSEARLQGWVWTLSVPGDARGDSFMSHLQSDTGILGTSSLASASTPWAPYVESLPAIKHSVKQDRRMQYLTCCQWDTAVGEWLGQVGADSEMDGDEKADGKIPAGAG